MSDNNEQAFKRKQVAEIVNDALSRLEKYGEAERHEMVQELGSLKEAVQKCCDAVDAMYPRESDLENKNKIFWLLGELEKRLNGPARNFISPRISGRPGITELGASPQTHSERKGE